MTMARYRVPVRHDQATNDQAQGYKTDVEGCGLEENSHIEAVTIMMPRQIYTTSYC
jgi:hypothetical protein